MNNFVNTNGLDDILNFGKHKGSTVRDVMNTTPSYLAWLRDNVADTKHQAFFNEEVNNLLDSKIRSNRIRGGKYRIWADDPPPGINLLKVEAERQERLDEARYVAELAAQTAQSREAAYQQQWGAW